MNLSSDSATGPALRLLTIRYDCATRAEPSAERSLSGRRFVLKGKESSRYLRHPEDLLLRWFVQPFGKAGPLAPHQDDNIVTRPPPPQ
jgi:hypothetical protein